VHGFLCGPLRVELRPARFDICSTTGGSTGEDEAVGFHPCLFASALGDVVVGTESGSQRCVTPPPRHLNLTNGLLAMERYSVFGPFKTLA